MNELIKEAEKIYEKIDNAQVHLINARLNNDEEDKKSAISEIETAMCNAMQLLKCFIERKDNIVDLSEVFHNVTEEPDRTRDILIVSYIFGYYVPPTLPFSEKKWGHCISDYAINRWAYVEDLLPKGGE